MNVLMRIHSRFSIEIACENSLLVRRTGVLRGESTDFNYTFVPSHEHRLLLHNSVPRQYSDPTGPATAPPES
jgi:hypothetical protein